MDGMIKFDGVIGIFIMLATIALLLLIAAAAFFSFFSEIKNPKLQDKTGWSRHFLLAAVIFLLFDGAFFLFTLRNPTFEVGEAAVFDERMLTIWIPLHIIGFLLFAYTSRIVQKNKLAINNYLDKLR